MELLKVDVLSVKKITKLSAVREEVVAEGYRGES